MLSSRGRRKQDRFNHSWAMILLAAYYPIFRTQLGRMTLQRPCMKAR